MGAMDLHERVGSSAGLVRRPVGEAAPRDLCTDCGISRTSEPKRCGAACQFIKPDYDALERKVHGRTRNPARPDETFFGPSARMKRARRSPTPPWRAMDRHHDPHRGAPSRNRRGRAVLTMAPDPEDKWRPVPVLVTKAEGMAQCRGMRMGYAPLLALLEPARARGFKRLAVIGIPCQVYALRALEEKPGLREALCGGNALLRQHDHGALPPVSRPAVRPTRHDHLSGIPGGLSCGAALHRRAGEGDPLPAASHFQAAAGLLPLPAAPASTTPTCSPTSRWATWAAKASNGCWCATSAARNCWTCWATRSPAAPGSAGKRQGPVKGFMANVERAAGGLPLRGMPNWLRPSWVADAPHRPARARFARARLEMKAVETVLHLRRDTRGASAAWCRSMCGGWSSPTGSSGEPMSKDEAQNEHARTNPAGNFSPPSSGSPRCSSA